MTHWQRRRRLLKTLAALPLLTHCSAWPSKSKADEVALRRLELLERSLDGRLGVVALNTADGSRLDYRARERFPFASTFKLIAAAAILKRSESEPNLLSRRIEFGRSDVVTFSPITEHRIDDGLSVRELCAAALQYSDNTAANLLIRILGGPGAVTAFARSLGDREFRLDRQEPQLNSAIPGDPRDTTTPEAMVGSLRRLALGNALAAGGRGQLIDWLKGNTTGANRIRAGIPRDWQVGDKTGGGSYGSVSDVAVLWPPQRPPIVVAVYTTQRLQDAKGRNDVVASAAREVVGWLENRS